MNNKVLWWYVVHGTEDELSMLEKEWEKVHNQTLWKLQDCFMPTSASGNDSSSGNHIQNAHSPSRQTESVTTNQASPTTNQASPRLTAKTQPEARTADLTLSDSNSQPPPSTADHELSSPNFLSETVVSQIQNK